MENVKTEVKRSIKTDAAQEKAGMCTTLRMLLSTDTKAKCRV
jgi:hypothetical protein